MISRHSTGLRLLIGTLVLVALFINETFSQIHRHSSLSLECVVNEPTDEERTVGIERYADWIQSLGKQESRAGRNEDVLYTIPIVFHLIQENLSISNAEIEQMVNQLNDAFAKRGAFAGGELGINTNIEFCLASKAPDGSVVSGITRTQTDYGQFDMDLEDSNLKTIVCIL